MNDYEAKVRSRLESGTGASFPLPAAHLRVFFLSSEERLLYFGVSFLLLSPGLHGQQRERGDQDPDGALDRGGEEKIQRWLL